MTLTSDEPSESSMSKHMTDMSYEKEANAHSSQGSPVRSMDIVAALEATGHIVRIMSNGLIVGVSLRGVKNTRSVAVDIAYVLDLRDPSTNRTGLAIQSAVLSVINRGVDVLLQDIGLETVRMRHVRTIRGSITLPVVGSRKSYHESMIRATRTAYVVYEGVRPSRDFSWLTKNERIVEVSEFALVRKSDMRANLNAIENTIDRAKWNYLVQSTKGWYGIVGIVLGVILLLAAMRVAVVFGGDISIPVIVGVASLLAGINLVRTASKRALQFIDSLRLEDVRLNSLGDTTRLLSSSKQNERMFRLVTELNFIVSSLAADATSALVEGDITRAIRSASSIIDECVRVSPTIDNSLAMESADEGLKRFMGLFRSLDALSSDDEEASLALAYVGLSGNSGSTLSAADLLRHMTALNFALYQSGLLNPSTKDTIDDMLNRFAANLVVSTLSPGADTTTISPESATSPHVVDIPVTPAGTTLVSRTSECSIEELELIHDLSSADTALVSRTSECSIEELELIHDLSSADTTIKHPTAQDSPTTSSESLAKSSEAAIVSEDVAVGGAQMVLSRRKRAALTEVSKRLSTQQDSEKTGGEVESIGT